MKIRKSRKSTITVEITDLTMSGGAVMIENGKDKYYVLSEEVYRDLYDCKSQLDIINGKYEGGDT